MKHISSIAGVALLASVMCGQAGALQIGATGQQPDCRAGTVEKNAICFGAAGDGHTDNVAAFRAWFDALAAQPGSKGILPPGQYSVDSSVSGPPALKNAKDVAIIATGATILQSQTTQPGMTLPGSHFATILVTGGSGLTWTGGRIIGKADYTGKNQVPAHAAANLEVMNSDHVTIQGVRLDNWGFAGILIYDSNFVIIRDNQLVGPGSTTLFGGGGVIPPGGNYNFGIALEYTAATDPAQFNHDIEVTGNSILNAGTGILSGDTYRNVLIEHNVISRSIGQHGMYVDGLTDSTVSNNIVEDPYYNGIKTNPIYAGRNVLFSNNTVSIRTPGLGNGACLLITQSDAGKTSRNSNVTVQGGTYTGCGGYGIYARVVDGLEIEGAKISDVNGPGIVTYNVSRATVENNSINNTARAAIIAKPADGEEIDIKGNTITAPNTTHTGNPILDSVISVVPLNPGERPRANISGTTVTVSPGARPMYGIYADRAVTGMVTTNNLAGLPRRDSLKGK